MAKQPGFSRSAITPDGMSRLASEAATAFVADVAGRLKNRVQISTDGVSAYVAAIEDAFGKHIIDYALIIKTGGTEDSSGAAFRRASKAQRTKERLPSDTPIRISSPPSYVERLNAPRAGTERHLSFCSGRQ